MRKIIAMLLALLLLAALTATALAADVRRTTKSVKVYEDMDTHSEVLKKIGSGKDVLIEEDYGSWVGVLVEDPEGDGQVIGWIQAKYVECKHSWTDWKVDKKATCTKDGSRSRYCTICGKEQTKTIEKLGHDYGKWTVVKEATCAREGLRVRTCKTCGYDQEKTYLEDHTYGKWSMIKEPTCTEKGTRARTCRVCGYEDREAIEKLPHQFQYDIIVEATDHSAGTRASVCQVCGYTEDAQSYDPEGTLRRGDRSEEVYQMQQLLVDQGYLNAGGADGIFGGGSEKALIRFQTDQGLNPDGVAWPQTLRRLNHDFGPWETVKALTRTEPGERVRVCKDCGYEQRETVPVGDVMERGERGEKVRAIQQILKSLGFDPGSADGIYGRKLDRAFTDFDAAHGLTFEDGTVRPADVDALINAWFAAGNAPRKEGDAESPVDLALTVTPASDEATDADATTYTWSLTNLGSGQCMFTALLLTYGGHPDFTRDNLVMVIDGAALKPGAGNSVSGSFSVASNWGDGNLNFAAMAMDERANTKWLSNTVVFESDATREPVTVEPLPVSLNMASLADGEYHVAFDRGDIAKVTSGIYMNAVQFFTLDTYDLDEIRALTEGDTVVVSGAPIVVQTVEEHEDIVFINGGSDEENGIEFCLTEDAGAYRVLMFDDFATYTERGMTSLLIAPNAAFVDESDLDKGEVTTEYDGILQAMQDSENDSFDQDNTTVTLKGGKVTKIHRIYVP